MKKVLLVVVFALLALSMMPAVAQDKPFAGIELNVLTFTGPQIAEPLQRRAPDFEALTGAKVNVVTVPFSDLYTTILNDEATGTRSYQAFVFDPQWMGDFITPGYLEELDSYIAKDKDIQWDDVGQFFRNFSASYQGKTYTIPLDGDFHMVYYRTDVLADLKMDPPKTWDEYLAVAKAANGKDMNGDGTPDFGSCIAKKRGEQGYWWITSIAAPFIQSQGTSQGAFFDTDTFKPLVDNPAFIRALDIYKETTQYGSPDELSQGVGDTRGEWTAGRCALTMDWGDIGPLAVAEGSKVSKTTGAIITPGSTEVLDRATNTLVKCDDKTCPYAVDGVNHAPYAAYGGWSGAISAGIDQKQKDAAYAFFSYMSQPAQSNVDVTIGKTGFNPYRTSQFKDMTNWTKAGFSDDFAKNYLGAIEASLNSPNMVLDLRVPQNQRYQQVVLDEVVSRFLAGELNSADAAKEISSRWDEITTELGLDTQKAAYLATLGGIKGGS